METFIITSIEENQKIMTYLRKLLPMAQKGFLFKMTRKKNIVLNDKKIKGDEVLKNGDIIKLYFSKETFIKFSTIPTESSNLNGHPFHHQLDIVYEDDHIIVINKPVGKLSQPDGKLPNLVEDLEHYLSSETKHLIGFKPGICNRLDRNTSGLVVGGKTIRALQVINYAIAQRDIKKMYCALVKGSITETMILNARLEKDKYSNKAMIDLTSINHNITTIVYPIRTTGDFTQIHVQLETGKPHQIRAHLAALGYPIVGDSKYGESKLNQKFYKRYGLEHQLLHAESLTFEHIKEPLKYLEGRTIQIDPPKLHQKIVKEVIYPER